MSDKPAFIERFPTPESSHEMKGMTGYKAVSWNEEGVEKTAYLPARLSKNPYNGLSLGPKKENGAKSKPRKSLNPLPLVLPADFEGDVFFLANEGSASLDFDVKVQNVIGGATYRMTADDLVKTVLNWATEARKTALKSGVWLTRAALLEAIRRVPDGPTIAAEVEEQIPDAATSQQNAETETH